MVCSDYFQQQDAACSCVTERKEHVAQWKLLFIDVFLMVIAKKLFSLSQRNIGIFLREKEKNTVSKRDTKRSITWYLHAM